ncbi:M15 family metallopeptidase [Streptomyces sp. NPDC051218]|uniref:M15 family metallopeptidase n=1 Tax=Streptomyces sp. NPDC051218 TaxID=3365645 RepID=UPI0037977BF5
MTYNESARTAETADTSARRGRSTVFARRGRSIVIAALAIGGATLMGVVGCQSSQSSSASASISLGKAGGAVPDGVTVFDDETPAVAKLDPDLLAALRRAAKDAADDKITFYVNSGWRSPEYQDQLLREAVSTYGSKEKAARWVATPDTSPHVSGGAIDIGRSDATAWLSARGAGYGLCQIYRNESWHYELRPEAVEQGCPPMYADPTHDPRMQR